jgi:hypothetical protein
VNGLSMGGKCMDLYMVRKQIVKNERASVIRVIASSILVTNTTNHC